MPGRRMNTRAIKEVLRLKSLNFSVREISRMHIPIERGH